MGPFVRLFARQLASKTILLLTVLSVIEVHGVCSKPTHSRHLVVMLVTTAYKCR